MTPQLVAVAFDAADPGLVGDLMAAGELPTLRALAAEGAWTPVRADAALGPFPPWPSFASAAPFAQHEIGSLLRWRPERMAHADHVAPAPFWRGAPVPWGIFDVPLAAAPRHAGDAAAGFEVAGWWTGRLVPGRASVHPAAAARRLPRHPTAGHEPSAELDDAAAIALAQRLVAGVRARGRLLAEAMASGRTRAVLVAYHETHWGSHRLWHVLERPGSAAADAFADVFRAVDAELGRLVEQHPNAAVCAFAPYGMERRSGVPTVLGPLLEQLGHARLLAAPGLARASRAVPAFVRPVARRLAPPRARFRAWQARQADAYDWAATTAFALPTEQQGLVRVNLAGREALGTVPASEYDACCDRLAAELAATTDAEGRALVAAARRTSGHFGGAPPRSAPDLVIEWAPAAHADPVVLANGATAGLEAPWLTGQHAFDGWCVTRGIAAPRGPLAPEDVGALLAEAAA